MNSRDVPDGLDVGPASIQELELQNRALRERGERGERAWKRLKTPLIHPHFTQEAGILMFRVFAIDEERQRFLAIRMENDCTGHVTEFPVSTVEPRDNAQASIQAVVDSLDAPIPSELAITWETTARETQLALERLRHLRKIVERLETEERCLKADIAGMREKIEALCAVRDSAEEQFHDVLAKLVPARNELERAERRLHTLKRPVIDVEQRLQTMKRHFRMFLLWMACGYVVSIGIIMGQEERVRQAERDAAKTVPTKPVLQPTVPKK